MLTGAQYIGTTIGPAVGAILAIAIGFRGTILAAAALPLIAGTAVWLWVPSDQPGGVRGEQKGSRRQLEPFHWSYQFALAVLVYFTVFAANQLVRLATPTALQAIEGRTDVEGIAGLAFTLAGLASTISVLFLAPRFLRAGGLRRGLVLSSVLGAAGYAFLAMTDVRIGFFTGFLIVSVVLSAMIPTTNTLLAANVPRSRRGTGFGIAGSAQSVAMIVAPAGAALFAAVSLDLGFAVLAASLVALAAVIWLTMREPDLRAESER
jgi:MFS family permease